jgi:peptide/nickel transport system substrate-binding protein
VQFHKGFGELTAEDVKFSFERQIKRAPGTRFGVNLEVIKSIEVVDPHTVQIQLKSFDAIFLLRMVGYQQGYIVSKKAAEKFGEQFTWNPVGTGPFYFERHSPREKIVWAFDKYHGGRPQIDEVHWFDVPEDATKLIGLEKGTFDLLYPEAVTADFASQVEKMGAVIDRRGPGQQERFYINMTKAPFDDIRVRRAFMHAIDRKAIKETMYPGTLGKLAISCVPPGYFGYIPMKFPVQSGAGQEATGRGGPPNGFNQELLHQQVVLLSQGTHARPGAAQEGGHQRRAAGGRARHLPREHPEEPEPLRALRRNPDHRRRPLAIAVLRPARSRTAPGTRAPTSRTTGGSSTCSPRAVSSGT